VNTEWIGVSLRLAWFLIYAYKMFVKKQRTAGHGFMLGIGLILVVMSLSKILAHFISL
jgi:hypothetical protein